MLKDIVFSMDLLGDYSSLENLLISLEKSSRIFEVTSISFGSTPHNLGLQSVSVCHSQFQIQQTYNFNLQIKTHSY